MRLHLLVAALAVQALAAPSRIPRPAELVPRNRHSDEAVHSRGGADLDGHINAPEEDLATGGRDKGHNWLADSESQEGIRQRLVENGTPESGHADDDIAASISRLRGRSEIHYGGRLPQHRAISKRSGSWARDTACTASTMALLASLSLTRSNQVLRPIIRFGGLKKLFRTFRMRKNMKKNKQGTSPEQEVNFRRADSAAEPLRQEAVVSGTLLGVGGTGFLSTCMPLFNEGGGKAKEARESSGTTVSLVPRELDPPTTEDDGPLLRTRDTKTFIDRVPTPLLRAACNNALIGAVILGLSAIPFSRFKVLAKSIRNKGGPKGFLRFITQKKAGPSSKAELQDIRVADSVVDSGTIVVGGTPLAGACYALYLRSRE